MFIPSLNAPHDGPVATCRDCGRTFPTFAELYDQAFRVTANPTVIVCQICIERNEPSRPRTNSPRYALYDGD